MQPKSSTIFYHEDFYRQVELIPEENYFAAGKYINEQSHKLTSNYGIYHMSSRPEQSIKLLDRKIQLREIREILDSVSLMYSENVTTGYGSYIRDAKDTIVWGFEQYGLFVKYELALVEAIWLSDSPNFPRINTAQHLAKAIFETSKRYSLILVDWNKEILCRFNSERIVKDYLYQNYSFDYF